MKTSKLLLASLIAAASTTAFAADDMTTVDIEVGQYYFDFEDTPGSFIGPNQPLGAADGELDDSGGAVTIGWMISDDWNMKLHMYSANAEGTNAAAAGGCFGLKTIDGSSAFSNGTCGGIAALTYKTEVDYQGFDVMFGTPILESDLQTLSLYGSVSLARLEQSHSFGSLPAVPVVSLGDSLDTTYIGVGVGLDHVLNLTEHLTLVGNLRADALQAKTDLDAVQNLFGVYAVSDSDTDIIGRAVAKVGLHWNFGQVSIGVNAFAEYLSDVATVEHSVTEGVIEPSQIGSEDGTIYGYNATIGFEF